MHRADLTNWIDDYVSLWRADGTSGLDQLFAPQISYLPSPWAEPITGRDALAAFWEAERDGPDEEFTLTGEVVAVGGDTGVARISVDYGSGSRWRDLWVVTLDEDGRCTRFEEWPFAPDQPDGH